jgi:hypothetical protein
MTSVQLIIGLLLLLGGGEALVKGSVAVAKRLGLSPLLIGLTLVGFGTSTPELVASLRAALIGSPGIAIGNIVGSNIANVLLILGLAAVIFPLATTRQAFRRDGAVLIGASLLMLAVVLIGAIGRGVGLCREQIKLTGFGSTWFDRCCGGGPCGAGGQAAGLSTDPAGLVAKRVTRPSRHHRAAGRRRGSGRGSAARGRPRASRPGSRGPGPVL